MFIALLVEWSSSIFIKINNFVLLYIVRLYLLPHKLVILLIFHKRYFKSFQTKIKHVYLKH